MSRQSAYAGHGQNALYTQDAGGRIQLFMGQTRRREKLQQSIVIEFFNFKSILLAAEVEDMCINQIPKRCTWNVKKGGANNAHYY
eukprot:scaffold65140_cov76-Attheya_sp.AAC.3